MICQWILEVWNSIPIEMIIKSFKKCGISNALDGTEDDLLYNSNTEIDNIAEVVNENDSSAKELEYENE